MWTLEDNTNNTAGYLTIKCNGERVADAFPFAPRVDQKKLRERLAWMIEALNQQADWETDHIGPHVATHI